MFSVHSPGSATHQHLTNNRNIAESHLFPYVVVFVVSLTCAQQLRVWVHRQKHMDAGAGEVVVGGVARRCDVHVTDVHTEHMSMEHMHQ